MTLPSNKTLIVASEVQPSPKLNVLSLLNSGQDKALTRLSSFLNPACRERFFTLKGFAGTGKTFMLRALCEQFGSSSFVFSATTNQAAKELTKNLADYGIRAKTIFSILGIRMDQDQDRLVLKFPPKPTPVRRCLAVVVDEAGTMNIELVDYITKLPGFVLKWIFVGDPAQLPPVGEPISKVWGLATSKALLTQVMRNGDHILDLATHIRRHVVRYPYDKPLRLRSSHTSSSGVWKYSYSRFLDNIGIAAERGLFQIPSSTKLVAWRNKTVDEYNNYIRSCIFGNDAESPFLVSDRLMIASPVEVGGHIIANIDEEGTVTSVKEDYHTYHPDINCYYISLNIDDRASPLELRVVHPSSAELLFTRLSDLAATARSDNSKWRNFWALKNDFHSVRYGYAFTSHRAQGSTLINTFLDTTDVLANKDRQTALRSLYVGSSRPTTVLALL